MPRRAAGRAGMLRFLDPPADVDLPLGRTGLVLEKQRRFLRKSVTLAIAIATLAPLLWWKNELAAGVYLGILVVIHVFALAVFLHRTPWRSLFAHRWAFLARVAGLVAFGGLLGLLRYEPDSSTFWVALTLLWFYHVGALALLHVRHRKELATLSEKPAECPIPWHASVKGPPR